MSLQEILLTAIAVGIWVVAVLLWYGLFYTNNQDNESGEF